MFAFLIITITLLIAISIYCCLIKHQANQKHLLPFQVTSCSFRCTVDFQKLRRGRFRKERTKSDREKLQILFQKRYQSGFKYSIDPRTETTTGGAL